jgi:hypothetical protein
MTHPTPLRTRALSALVVFLAEAAVAVAAAVTALIIALLVAVIV